MIKQGRSSKTPAGRYLPDVERFESMVAIVVGSVEKKVTEFALGL